MTLEEAEAVFGPVILETERFQVRGRDGQDGLHVYSFRKNEKGEIEVPRGFMRGSNSLHHEALKG